MAIRKLLIMIGISAVGLTAVGLARGFDVVYPAAAVMLLYATGRERYAVLLWMFATIAGTTLGIGLRLLPHTYDATLWRIDGMFGFEPSVYAMLITSTSPLLSVVARVVYCGSLIGIALAIIFSRDAKVFVTKLVIAATAGYLLYYVVPACGPWYFMMGQLAVAPRNAMPSGHMTWGLLVWYELRGQRLAARIVADLFLIFTVIGTLGFGEHYVIDLLIAVPFWLAIERVGNIICTRYRGYEFKTAKSQVTPRELNG